MLDVSRWLAEQGLGHHADAFAENGIGDDILRELTDAELKEIGLNLGDRKRLLKALARLDAQPAQDRPEPAEPTTAPAVPDEAERRQLTVVFVDLVDSTALSRRLDPEEMGQVLRDYQNVVAGEVTRLEGHIAKFMGDGVLAYFGWPRAHEDEAERAVRAAGAITAAVGRLVTPGGEPLSVRVGVATGLVVVGELIGSGDSAERAVVGDTPNLAARLQGLAAPGQVVVADTTRRLLGTAFTLDDLGPQDLKGFAEPLAAFVVTGETPLESRFESRSGPQPAPMVERDQELALLLDRWSQVKAGEGQGVLLVGEAGIGKSRIVRALIDALSSETHLRIRYQCSPYHSDSALWPVAQQLGRAAGFRSDDPPDVALDKLEALIGVAADDARAAAAVIGPLLGLDGERRYGRLGLTPQAQRARTLEALVAQLTGLAQQQPVLVILEDGQWADATTLELMELCLDRITDVPALILLTSRPDNPPTLGARSHVTQLTLNRLGRAGVEAIVARLRGERPMPADVIDAIVARTDGVPLFAEELTKAVLENGETGVPATLYDALVARLDHLPEVKEVAQVGACIGREFNLRLLSAVADRPEDELTGALDKLARAELVFRRGTPLEATYSFKHALVRDVAYQSMLKSRRQRLHGEIAEALRRHFPESAARAPELLAEHYMEAGLIPKAIEFGLLAGQLAARRAANAEAVQQLQRVLELLEAQPEGRARAEQELEVLTHLGTALLLVKGWTAPEVEAVYARAQELARQLEKSADMVPALIGSWLFYTSRGRYDHAEEATEQIFEVAEATGERDLLLQAHHAAWPIPALRGAFADSQRCLEEGLALYDFDQHRHHALTYMGHDPAVCAHAVGSTVSYALGRLGEAEDHAQSAVQLARRLEHAPTLAFALWIVGFAQAARGDVARTRTMAEELLRLSEEQKLPQMRASALILGGWAMAADGEPRPGRQQIDAGLSAWRRIGMRNFLQVFEALAAEASLCDRDHEEGLRQAAEALAVGKQTGERWWEPRVLTVQGNALLHGGDAEAAEEHFDAALSSAREQGAKSWELCAATALARLWAEQGERRKAHDLLAPVYGWFTEGFDMHDLENAEALLDQLA